ncbi:glycosyltransferase family 2 protein [Paenibacillus sp. JX-17]|uniref:Glycosyltransferase family 2 protein n=1 Tax=Paenibacillus lacisoli TaxID=3064525 RepID=A0ABT9CJZ3_9BACL|nr:glycosyltransferase family 2 protein [Paenibacillus sp. JX-17]MDO7908858.1 glycosyltransferase family 2 protein [Paenibacillus sp. JX-17]
MDVSILIVSYNTCRLTLDCLDSVFASKTGYQYEVIVIDNQSSDDSVQAIGDKYPEITLITNDENTGFATANNQGMEAAQGRYILLLNSDTVIQDDTLQTMIEFMDNNENVGASGCKVILPDGSLDKACKRGFPTPSASFYYAFGFSKFFPDHPKFNQYQLGHLDADEAYEVDCLVGAFMLVRRETIDQIGGLDETFFMYGEDIDWCYRMKQAGWGIYYYPQTCIVHLKGGSARLRPKKVIYEFHRAMWVFYRKHYSKQYNLFTSTAVYLGIGVKLGAAMIKRQVMLARPKPKLEPARTKPASSEVKA